MIALLRFSNIAVKTSKWIYINYWKRQSCYVSCGSWTKVKKNDLTTWRYLYVKKATIGLTVKYSYIEVYRHTAPSCRVVRVACFAFDWNSVRAPEERSVVSRDICCINLSFVNVGLNWVIDPLTPKIQQKELFTTKYCIDLPFYWNDSLESSIEINRLKKCETVCAEIENLTIRYILGVMRMHKVDIVSNCFVFV